MLSRVFFRNQIHVYFMNNNVLSVSKLCKRTSCIMNGGKTEGVLLNFVTQKLQEFASTSLAESWDNVGLLLEPANKRLITRILLTNDLTEDVMDEALLVSANLIISYHPPIFAPLKKITNSTWKERIITRCLANDIALYSPHTSWDVVQGGVNDWLASAFTFAETKPLIIQKYDTAKSNYILTVESSDVNLFETFAKDSSFRSDLKMLITEKSMSDSSKTKFTIQCTDDSLKKIVPLLQQSSSVLCYYVNPQHAVDEVVSGIGRMCKLETPITIREAVDKLKKHIGTPFVQLALARKASPEHKVRTIAFVAGSGGSVMEHIHCDLKVTGEASHHQVLDSIHKGSSVILTNHSNSERGFLWKFKEILASKLNNPSVQIVVATTDMDPLKVF